MKIGPYPHSDGESSSTKSFGGGTLQMIKTLRRLARHQDIEKLLFNQIKDNTLLSFDRIKTLILTSRNPKEIFLPKKHENI